jgi:hypothetical protein
LNISSPCLGHVLSILDSALLEHGEISIEGADNVIGSSFGEVCYHMAVPGSTGLAGPKLVSGRVACYISETAGNR